MFLWRICILFLYPLATYQRSLPSSSSYIGAVVEYAPVTKSEDGRSLGDANADNYLKFIKKAKEYSVDIIVFPESSLSLSSSSDRSIARSEAASYIPPPRDGVIPCNDENQAARYASSLEKLSCAARLYRMYVVINHREKVDCEAGSPGCPADGYLIYNTHVTFDRSGRVISRYRKYNLFGEPGTNVTEAAEPGVFETDFGVKFGQFICFDILFESPAVNLTRDLGITDIVYSSHWYAELPYGFNNEIQAAWAYASDTNFLAAGHSNPGTGSGGSGIFIGREGHAKVVSSDSPSNILIVADIPKKSGGKRLLSIDQKKVHTYVFNKSEISTSHEEIQQTGNYRYKTTNLSNYTSELIDSKTSTYDKKLCNQGLCCEFKLNIDFDESIVKPDTEYYKYRVAVFNNTMSFGGQGYGDAKICGLIACLDEKIESCGKLFEPSKEVVMPTQLSVNISIPRSKEERTVFMPVTLARAHRHSSPMPMNVTEFAFRARDKLGYEMALSAPRKDLLTFVVVGRNFGRQAEDEAGNNGAPCRFVFSALVLMILAGIVRVF